jgi:undecaprenyl-diphosphatase
LLGLIQGATEFLPVSSSAHLALAPRLLGFADPGLTFDLALHLGTLVAVLLHYRAAWTRLLLGAARDPRGAEGRRLAFVALATVPAVVAGLLVGELAETTFRQPRWVAACLIVFAGVMLLADRRPGTREWRGEAWTAALAIGAAQALALMPGVSRSGATICAGMLWGLSREDAAELSFLMSAPITAGAIALKLGGLSAADLTGPFLWAVAVSGLSGAAAIGVLLRWLPRHGLAPYAWYRVALGALTLRLAA